MKIKDPSNQTEFELLGSFHIKLSPIMPGMKMRRSSAAIKQLLDTYLFSMSDIGQVLEVFVEEPTENELMIRGQMADILDALYSVNCLTEECKNEILEQYAVDFIKKVSGMISPSKQLSFFHKISTVMVLKSTKPNVGSQFLKNSVSSSSL